MQYRPQSASALRCAVDIVRKKRLREVYLGDLVWLAAKSQYKRFELMPYSDYNDLLEGKASYAESERDRIRKSVEEMLDMFG